MTIERRDILLAIMMALGASGSALGEIKTTTFETKAPAEAFATMTATCDMCAWDVAGREAVFLSLALDGRYVQHLPLTRTRRAEYRMMLSRVETAAHRQP